MDQGAVSLLREESVGFAGDAVEALAHSNLPIADLVEGSVAEVLDLDPGDVVRHDLAVLLAELEDGVDVFEGLLVAKLFGGGDGLAPGEGAADAGVVKDRFGAGG